MGVVCWTIQVIGNSSWQLLILQEAVCRINYLTGLLVTIGGSRIL